MLKLEDFRTIFLITSFVGALIISSPALAFLFPSLASESFSELYLLGPSRMAEGYPSNVKLNETYQIFVGIRNSMSSPAYYALYVKLRNQSELPPNNVVGTPSPLPALYEYRVLLGDEETWEAPLNFSFKGFTFHGNSCSVDVLTIDSLDLHVDKTASLDSKNKGYFLKLFLELWIFDTETRSFAFHNRFVGIWLNMTDR